MSFFYPINRFSLLGGCVGGERRACLVLKESKESFSSPDKSVQPSCLDNQEGTVRGSNNYRAQKLSPTCHKYAATTLTASWPLFSPKQEMTTNLQFGFKPPLLCSKKGILGQREYKGMGAMAGAVETHFSETTLTGREMNHVLWIIKGTFTPTSMVSLSYSID